MGRKKDFKFVIPEVKTELVGTQGERAEFMSYCLDDDVSTESILAEIRRQPHMAGLADYISEDRKIYLLEGEDLEVLQLAASYIATYHRIWDVCIGDEERDCDYDDEIDEWENGDVNERTFDFGSNIPYLTISDLIEVYHNGNTPGFGSWMYREEKKTNRPWWTMSESAPIIIYSTNSLNCMPVIFRAMQSRELVILLQHRKEHPFMGGYLEEDDMFGRLMNLESLSFELETEMLRLEKPEDDSDYKKEILRQLAKEKGEGLQSFSETGKILSMILQSRGNVSNQTISKAVSNAYMRRKRTGKLMAKDFEYLSAFHMKDKAMSLKKEEKMELVGQEEVRKQLQRIVKSMVFQKKRMEMGLPYEKIHYTFAFMGAPGTGKTTWAMRLAEEMQEQGLLENTESICINAAELKAKYVGHTTGKVKALFEQYGVIILDEAYSLTEGDNQQDSFSGEAMAQLCVELENHSTDRLVIFAGYGGSSNREDNRMLQFLRSNPGINSRISFKVHFDNFKPSELVQVFHTMMQHGGYKTDHMSDQLMEEMFRYRMKERAFGNCREVRNLVDRVKIQMAERLMEQENYTKETAVKVEQEDILNAVREIMKEIKGLTLKKACRK